MHANLEEVLSLINYSVPKFNCHPRSASQQRVLVCVGCFDAMLLVVPPFSSARFQSVKLWVALASVAWLALVISVNVVIESRAELV